MNDSAIHFLNQKALQEAVRDVEASFESALEEVVSAGCTTLCDGLRADSARLAELIRQREAPFRWKLRVVLMRLSGCPTDICQAVSACVCKLLSDVGGVAYCDLKGTQKLAEFLQGMASEVITRGVTFKKRESLFDASRPRTVCTVHLTPSVPCFSTKSTFLRFLQDFQSALRQTINQAIQQTLYSQGTVDPVVHCVVRADRGLLRDSTWHLLFRVLSEDCTMINPQEAAAVSFTFVLFDREIDSAPGLLNNLPWLETSTVGLTLLSDVAERALQHLLFGPSLFPLGFSRLLSALNAFQVSHMQITLLKADLIRVLEDHFSGNYLRFIVRAQQSAVRTALRAMPAKLAVSFLHVLEGMGRNSDIGENMTRFEALCEAASWATLSVKLAFKGLQTILSAATSGDFWSHLALLGPLLDSISTTSRFNVASSSFLQGLSDKILPNCEPLLAEELAAVRDNNLDLLIAVDDGYPSDPVQDLFVSGLSAVPAADAFIGHIGRIRVKFRAMMQLSSLPMSGPVSDDAREHIVGGASDYCERCSDPSELSGLLRILAELSPSMDAWTAFCHFLQKCPPSVGCQCQQCLVFRFARLVNDLEAIRCVDITRIGKVNPPDRMDAMSIKRMLKAVRLRRLFFL